MSVIKINISEVLKSGTHIVKARKNVLSVKQDVSAIRRNVDPRIMNRNGIKGDFEHITYELGSLERKLDRIINFAENSANEYYKTEQRIKRLSSSINGVPHKMLTNTKDMSNIFAQFKSVNKPKVIEESFVQQVVRKCKGTSNAIIKKSKEIAKKIKGSYDKHGWAYNVWEYGKVIVNGLRGVVKVVASIIGTVASGGSASPITVLVILSGANNIVNSVSDFVSLNKKDYSKVGNHNWLKNMLVKHGAIIGEEFFGSKDIGENIGKTLYLGVDLVLFLDSIDSIFKNFGKVNTQIEGKPRESFVWGKSSWKDLKDTKIKPDFSLNFIIRKIKKTDPKSVKNLIFEIVKGLYSMGKKEVKVIGDVKDLAY